MVKINHNQKKSSRAQLIISAAAALIKIGVYMTRNKVRNLMKYSARTESPNFIIKRYSTLGVFSVHDMAHNIWKHVDM